MTTVAPRGIIPASMATRSPCLSKIRALVKKHGLREMGRRLGLPPTTIGNWLSGKRRLKGLSLADLAVRMKKL